MDCSLSFEVVLDSCTHDKLKNSDYKPKPYEDAQHEIFLGTAQADLSEITERESPSVQL